MLSDTDGSKSPITGHKIRYDTSLIELGVGACLTTVARELPSLGHNAQVENPEQVWLLAIERF